MMLPWWAPTPPFMCVNNGASIIKLRLHPVHTRGCGSDHTPAPLGYLCAAYPSPLPGSLC